MIQETPLNEPQKLTEYGSLDPSKAVCNGDQHGKMCNKLGTTNVTFVRCVLVYTITRQQILFLDCIKGLRTQR